MFRAGDVVRSKLGGRLMCVSRESLDEKHVHCDWFEGTSHKEDVFCLKQLRKVGEKEAESEVREKNLQSRAGRWV